MRPGATVQSVACREDQLVDLLTIEALEGIPRDPQVIRYCAHRGHPHWKLTGRKEVDGASRAIGLNEAPPLPQLAAHLLRSQTFDSSAESELAGAHDLGLDAARLADHVQKAPAVRAMKHAVARETPHPHLIPCQREHRDARPICPPAPPKRRPARG